MDKLDDLKGLSYNPLGCHWHRFLDILEMGCELAILYVPISDLQIVGQAIQRKLHNCALVYDRNHLFGLGPIPKPKLKIGRNFRPIPKLTKTVKS